MQKIMDVFLWLGFRKENKKVEANISKVQIILDNLLAEEHIESKNVLYGLDCAKERLADLLDTKKAFEEKAINLFKSQIGIASIMLALTKTGILQISEPNINFVIFSFIVFIIGAVLSLLSLQVNAYGAFGEHPIDFLQKEVMTDKKALNELLLFMLHSHIERINISEESNKIKVSYIKASIWLILIATAPLVTLMFNLF